MTLDTGKLNYWQHEALGLILDSMGLLAVDEDMPKYIEIKIIGENDNGNR